MRDLWVEIDGTERMVALCWVSVVCVASYGLAVLVYRIGRRFA